MGLGYSAGAVNLSRRFIVMLGYAQEETVFTISAVMELIHPDDKQRMRAVMHDQLSRTTSAFETELAW